MTFPRPAHVKILDNFNGAPLDPQPATLSIEAAGKGIVGRWPDGTEKHVNPPETVNEAAERRVALLAELAKLDQITGPRLLEGVIKGTSDQFILDKIAEKEELRAELAALT